MKKLPLFISLLLLLTCAKEDSQAPNTPPSQITRQYTLSVSAGDGGSVSTAGGTFASGTQVSLTATPNSGYSFSGWSNGSTANPLTVTLNSNTSITANFQVIVNSYTLTVSAGEGGSVSTEGGEYEEGTEVTITATPDEEYEFTGWSDGEISISRVVTISSDITISASFQILPFMSRSPSYPGINNTTDFIKMNYYYPGNNVIPGLDENNLFTYNGSLFKTTLNHSTYLDFDNNGYLDLFSVLTSVADPDHPQFNNNIPFGGDCSNIIRIVKNIFTQNSEEYIYDSPYGWPAKPYVNDFNGDGIDDIIMGGTNAHICASYSGDVYGEHLPTHVYFINTDGSFERRDVTPATSFYDLTTGDIDNDGDVDIVYLGAYLYYPSPNNQEGKPWVYLNDGLGNFTQANSNDHFIGLEDILSSVESGRIHNNIINLFDLNNDNILDLVLGSDPFWQSVDTENEKQEDYPFWVQAFNEYVYGARVYWGQGQGIYNMSDYSDINNDWINDLNFNREKLMYMGMSFVDINNDNYYDIAFSGSANYKGDYVQIVVNNGDQTFSDITTEIFDDYWNYKGDESTPNIKVLMVYDKDNDGDFDLIPSGSERTFNAFQRAWDEVFYYRNDVGLFKKIIID